MPNTPSLALPYPAPAAVPDVPYWLQQLAEAVDTIVADRTKDSGNVTNALTSVDTANWTVVSQQAIKVGRIVQVYLDLVYKGTAATSPADGNIANITIGALAAAYRPGANGAGVLAAVNGRDALVAVYPSGTVALAALGNGTTLAQNTALTVVGTYIAGTY